MKCNEAQSLIHAYIDGELDLRTSLDIEEHLAECQACTEQSELHRQMRARIGDPSLRFTASLALRDDLRTRIMLAFPARQESHDPASSGGEASSPIPISIPGRGNEASGRPRPSGSGRPFLVRWFTVAALVVISFSSAWMAASMFQPSHDEVVAREVLDSHIRSLMADHLIDVVSSDKHTVKPWFNGKVDFSPPVVDLGDRGFSLAGGRMDYVDGHVVAGLAYRRQKHVINLFLWPSTHAPSSPVVTARNGYNLLHWYGGGMECWGVSDLNVAEMDEWAGLFNEQFGANLTK